ncbi:MAG: ABC transporter ATP-binding protein [Thermodesulfobacteriota bacterium]|nr:ABC transporter ATP-binding protein [Thermodesulfobacteriota bacterium]
MSETPLFELKHISFKYPDSEHLVLDRVDFALGERKIGLIGANGSGKTTLFHVIMGLQTPLSGKVLFHGRPVRNKSEFREMRKDVGLIFQNADDQLFSPTVIEDVAFGPLNLGESPDDAGKIARKTLADLGLSGLESRITHRLSGGEKKLVSLATILAMNPKALLIDEPTNDLDPATRARLITILNELNQPCVIISHDWDFLAETVQDIFGLDHGRIIRCEKADLHNHPHAHPFGGQPHHHV